MNPINDGGPAFPLGDVSETTGQPINGFFNPGMTLRDWFAGKALNSRGLYGANVREKEVAEECYRIADAMLTARENGGGR